MDLSPCSDGVRQQVWAFSASTGSYLLTLWGPVGHMPHRIFKCAYLRAQMELDNKFGHFWHFQMKLYHPLKSQFIEIKNKKVLFEWRRTQDRKNIRIERNSHHTTCIVSFVCETHISYLYSMYRYQIRRYSVIPTCKGVTSIHVMFYNSYCHEAVNQIVMLDHS